jgi:DNA-binding transcriptional ArsR family regulator
VTDVFEILADPTRRRLVEALRAGERSVSELVEVVDIGQPGVSRQLAILEDARFVRVRPEGRRRLYALRPEPFRELDDWTHRYRELWEARLDRLGAELDRRTKARSRDRGRRTSRPSERSK